jgi:type II secretory ATPase GspE/PulE/Tfp pilus assembly ATPase PilB-like protein
MASAEHFDLSNFQLDHELLKRVPVELMFHFNFVPVKERADGRLVIAVADPNQNLMMDEISFLLNQRVVATVSPLEQICDVLTRTERGR